MPISIDRQMDRLRARKAELQKELAQLEKIEAELERTIEQALRTIGAAADGAVRGARTAVKAERKRGRPRKAAPKARAAAKTARNSAGAGKATGNGKRGRPKGSGKRQAQAVRIITTNPGIRTSEVAKKMGIGPNYLYRLLPDLAKDGAISKKGSGWVPASGNSKAKAKPRKAAAKA